MTEEAQKMKMNENKNTETVKAKEKTEPAVYCCTACGRGTSCRLLTEPGEAGPKAGRCLIQGKKQRSHPAKWTPLLEDEARREPSDSLKAVAACKKCGGHCMAVLEIGGSEGMQIRSMLRTVDAGGQNPLGRFYAVSLEDRCVRGGHGAEWTDHTDMFAAFCDK